MKREVVNLVSKLLPLCLAVSESWVIPYIKAAEK